MSIRPPMIIPTDQQAPPAQTSWGTLEMVDPLELDVLPGEPMNDQLYTNYLEYVDTFTVSSSDSPNQEVFCIDPLNFVGKENTFVPGSPQPKWLLMTRSCEFAQVTPTYVFQAVKPPGVGCRLILEHVPRYTAQNLDKFLEWDPCPHGQITGVFPQSDNPKFRGIKIEWDTQQPLSVRFPGWCTSLWRPMRYDRTLADDATKLATYPPIETISSGILRIYTAQRPMPGSIYPNSFEINVFKSFPDFVPSVFTSYYNTTEEPSFGLDGFVV